ncbi:Copper amine oxidase [Crenothrix polyspora]|uniref:Amine oxidase n=1 Tax=Crenothrix polyspora TaxID=360316 RepID=A0A1R4H9Z0_9GAMM|nr:hypothetical protein [Crenothrix polyspora]SJM92841.1 Copper amine oxidase [Crenothrix polyspora]
MQNHHNLKKTDKTLSMRNATLISTLCAFTGCTASPTPTVSPRITQMQRFTAMQLDAPTETAANACSHPLDPLNQQEIILSVQLAKAHPNIPAGAFFPNVVLNEPLKEKVLAFQSGGTFSREALVEAYDRPKNQLYRVIVDLRAKKVTAFDKLPQPTQPAAFLDEFSTILPVINQDPGWRAAMKKRGVKPEDVYLDVWAGGDLVINVDRDGKAVPPGTRIMRVLSFLRGGKPNPYDRPIEGVVVAVDMNRLKVLQVTDTVVAPVSQYNGKDSSIQREPLQPLRVEQAKPSYQLCGQEVSWQGWRFRFALHPRDGLVLYTVHHENKGVLRPVAYRLSLTEIYVPYGIPDINWVWRTAFDVGEYGLGRNTNPLSPDTDVPNNATFFNARIADDVGGSFVYPNAVALYERNAGLLWKRVDPTSVEQDRREARQLVITSNTWIGNYIYGINYIFKMSGELEVRVEATGTTLNQGVNSLKEGAKHGHVVDVVKSVNGGTALVAAPNHQHFFSFRLDLDVDGAANRVSESNVNPQDSALGNAFVAKESLITTEANAKRNVDINKARNWKIFSSDEKNALNMPTGYTLSLGDIAVPYSSSTFSARKRAGFAEYPLWVTQYHPNELYATGDYPNQGVIGEGLPKYSGKESLVDQDLVFWVTSGLTHIPDVEQYPVMNTESLLAFRLLPYGFFKHNPALK